MPDPINEASAIGVDFINALIDALTSKGNIGEAAKSWVIAQQSTLVTLGKDTLKSFLDAIKSGSNSDLLNARVALINSMTWPEVLEFQAASTLQLQQAANDKFRVASLIDSLGGIGQKLVPILATTLFGML